MQALTEAYIGYQSDQHVAGIKIKTFKNLNATNAYTVDYVRYVANAYNFILGRFAYFSRLKNRPVSEIIVTDADLSKNIGCHVKHSSVVLNQLKSLFDLNFEQKSRFGARYITSSEKFIKFLSIFTEEELEAYIDAQNIKSNDLIYAIYHLFRYRVWTVTDSKLSITQKERKIKHQERMRDYYHLVVSSNRSDFVRIELIEANLELLTQREKQQLDSIKEARKCGKLSFYWNKILIKLEQKITAITRVKATETFNQETHLPMERKLNEKVKDVAHEAATSKAQRLPEDSIIITKEVLSMQDILEVVVSFNNMIEGQSIPLVKEIDSSIINSIHQLANLNGKAELLDTIKKVKSLYHDSKYRYKMTFKRFLKPETYKMLKDDTKVPHDVDVGWFKDYLKEQGHASHYHQALDQLPQVSSLDDINAYLVTIK